MLSSSGAGGLEIVHSKHLEQHKPGRIKPGRVKRAALSLQGQNGDTFDVCRVTHPGTKQLPIHISGAAFAANLQIWLLGTTPFDTTPFICLRLVLRAIFVLIIFRLRIFESKFRNRCAKKLDVHEENPPPSFKNLSDSSSEFRDS